MTSEKTKEEILAEVISEEATNKRQAEGLQHLLEEATRWAEYYEASAKKDTGWSRGDSIRRSRLYRAKIKTLKAELPFKENGWKAQGGKPTCKPVDELKVAFIDKNGRKWYNLSLRLPYSEMRALEETFSLMRNRRNYALRNMLRKECGLPELAGFNPDPMSRYVKGLRNKHKISQRQLSEITGINQSYISIIENAGLTKEPLLEHLKSLAKFDGIPLLKLLRIAGVVENE